MNLETARETYYQHSGRASDVSRQLAFAGFAVIWVFKQTVAGQDRVPPALFPAAFAFGLALGCDCLHYLTAAAVWGIFHRYRECKQKKEKDFLAPTWINLPALVFFLAKHLAVGVGFVLVARYLCSAPAS